MPINVTCFMSYWDYVCISIFVQVAIFPHMLTEHSFKVSWFWYVLIFFRFNALTCNTLRC